MDRSEFRGLAAIHAPNEIPQEFKRQQYQTAVPELGGRTRLVYKDESDIEYMLRWRKYYADKLTALFYGEM